jgi:GntR family transcriptional regulator, gluconate operon transcriptional repressor
MGTLRALAGTVSTPRQQGLGDQVLQQLRVLIITGKIAAGTHLVESELSTTFDVSRGPIRDALVQLEAEGLVESRRRGAFVRGLTTKDIDELYSVREAIELMAVRLTAEATEDRWEFSQQYLSALKDAAKSGDYLRFAHADMAFHTSFYTVAGNGRLLQVWRQYEPTFAVLLELTTAEDVDLTPSYDSHEKIFQLMVEGKVEAASRLLQEHLIGSRTRLINAVARVSASAAGADAAEAN